VKLLFHDLPAPWTCLDDRAGHHAQARVSGSFWPYTESRPQSIWRWRKRQFTVKIFCPCACPGAV